MSWMNDDSKLLDYGAWGKGNNRQVVVQLVLSQATTPWRRRTTADRRRQADKDFLFSVVRHRSSVLSSMTN